MTTKPDIYQTITDRMVEALEAGTAPWRKPWNSATGKPRNLQGRPYRGVNLILLGMSPYSSPYWMTFKQAKERGGTVKKGEHSTMVVFWKRLRVIDKDTKEPVTIPMLRYFNVFNLEQTEDVKVPKRVSDEQTAVAGGSEPDPVLDAEVIVKGYDNGPKVKRTGSEAFYVWTTDTVTVPPAKAFPQSDEFYSTLFHELGHSTGHPDRLARDLSGHFGCDSYGREELVAEMTSAFLCTEAGIEETLDNSAAYLASWIRTIKEDPKAVVVAAGAAQRAADHILGRTWEPAPETTEA